MEVLAAQQDVTAEDLARYKLDFGVTRADHGRQARAGGEAQKARDPFVVVPQGLLLHAFGERSPDAVRDRDGDRRFALARQQTTEQFDHHPGRAAQ